jgi:hypothetical protein
MFPMSCLLFLFSSFVDTAFNLETILSVCVCLIKESRAMFFFLSLLFDAFLFEEEEEEEEELVVGVVFFPFSVRDFVERAKNTPRSKTFRTGEEEEEEEEERGEVRGATEGATASARRSARGLTRRSNCTRYFRK